jgi:FkbM family methyltransferase
MEQYIKAFLQSIFNKLGYRIGKMDENVSLYDAYNEQKRILSNSDVKVIFDIGAADGRTSEHYHQLFPNATIYAFEPLPKSFEQLKKNVVDKSYIIPLNYAVSDKIGTAEFHITELNDASSLLNPNQTGSSFDRHHVLKNVIKVNTITIDEICKKYEINCINLLKLDAQGAEGDILKGATNMLSKNKVELIYSECQFIQLYDKATQFFELNSILHSHGYKLFNLFNLVHNQKGQLSWGDAIFIIA